MRWLRWFWLLSCATLIAMNGDNWQYVCCFFKSYPLSNWKRFVFLVWCMITRNNSSIFFKTIGNLNYSLLASSALSQSLFKQVIVLDTQTSAGGLSSSPDLLPCEDCVWWSPRGYRTCSYGRAVITPFVSWVWWNDSHSCTQRSVRSAVPLWHSHHWADLRLNQPEMWPQCSLSPW